jgi:hypothetical protein
MKLVNRLLVTIGFTTMGVSATAQAGSIIWDGFCSNGVLILTDSTCSSGTPCKLYTQVGSGTPSLLTELTSAETPVAIEVPRSSATTWWFEKSSVIETNVLSIDPSTQCFDNN